MIKNRIRLLRLTVLTALVVFSLLSGAWIHAYAVGNNEHSLPLSSAAYTDGSLRLYSEPVSHRIIVDVTSGDTLWSIAEAHLPKNENIHSYVEKIKKTNGLKRSSLQVGQIIYLP